MAAIYQWFIADAQVFTTTLYPIEATEAMELSIDFDVAYLEEVPADQLTHGVTMLEVTIREALLYAPEQIDEITHGVTLLEVSIRPGLLEAPEQVDYLTHGVTMLEVTIEMVLITVYTPDEAMDIAIALDTGSCSLTAV